MLDKITTKGPAHKQSGIRNSKSRAVPHNGGAQPVRVTLSWNSPAIASIVVLWRRRVAWMRASQRLDLQAQALCRGFCDGDKTKARTLWKQAQKGSAGDISLDIILDPIKTAITTLRGDDYKRNEKQLIKLTRETIYYPIVKAMRGFGEINLAGLIGAAGEIASYRNPSCLWMRMGLGVIDGERQRKCKDKDKAIIHGYSPQRHAQMFVLGDTLIRAKGPYKGVYDQHKAEKLAAGYTKKHAHLKAMRFMVKRVLRDLWIAAQPSLPLETTTSVGAPPPLATLPIGMSEPGHLNGA